MPIDSAVGARTRSLKYKRVPRPMLTKELVDVAQNGAFPRWNFRDRARALACGTEHPE